jgi:hypothetical protein
VFWNKEDPPHFNRFIHRAPLFDFVFTSDADMIPKYCAALKHNRVAALPFAAQPKVHNPIVETDRLDNVCFAGAYYAADYDERRADMEHILRPALAFGLHIYDRQHGVVGANAQAYRFPDIYQGAIKGRLEYNEMIKAYKRYKVFLNVNSVKRSPTMFSRRVFELLASGTPVISSYSVGIEQILGNDIVHLAGSEQETLTHLERLLHDDSYWACVALKGVRAVCSSHTYARRLAEVCQRVGLSSGGQQLLAVEAVAFVKSAEQLRRLTATLARQKYRNFRLTLSVTSTISHKAVQVLKEALPDIDVQVMRSENEIFGHLGQATGDYYVWMVNLEDYYGENFLYDAALTGLYADAELLGKATHYRLSSGALELSSSGPASDFRFVSSVAPGSLIARAGKLSSDQWRALSANWAIDFGQKRVLSIDRFNYVDRGGAVDEAHINGSGHPLSPALV